MSVSSPEPTQNEPKALSPSAGQIEIDLGRAIESMGGVGLTVSAETAEHPEDRAHRHRMEWADSQLTRRKDAVRFALSMLVGVALAGAALYLAFSRTASSEEHAWARNTLFALGGAVGGFYVGRKDGKE